MNCFYLFLQRISCICQGAKVMAHIYIAKLLIRKTGPQYDRQNYKTILGKGALLF